MEIIKNWLVLCLCILAILNIIINLYQDYVLYKKLNIHYDNKLPLSHYLYNEIVKIVFLVLYVTCLILHIYYEIYL